ncbi:MAG: hypothetical protein WAK67_05630 [Xanthobacteraceae bacterium]
MMAAFENFEKKFHEALDRVSPRPRREDAAEADPYHSAEKGLNDEGVSLADFRAYMPQHSYIFMPSRELWPASSVNARLPPVIGPNSKPISPARWLDANAAVEQMT